jgi:hypothetical protein
MPKATIDENSDSLSAKHEVGLADNRKVTSPASDAISPEKNR